MIAPCSFSLEQFSEFDGHERVYELRDTMSGLHGFIAIHRTGKRAAVGGTRMFPYASEEDALRDVLRLSHAMSDKCAIAGVDYTGGKAVMIGDPAADKTPMLLKSYAQAVHELNGAFKTGEDVGISEADVQYMLTLSPHFIGRTGSAGDPSPFAALSAFQVMAAALPFVFGVHDFHGLTIGVKGVGKVGGALVDHLVQAGARVTVADLRPEAIAAVCESHPSIQVADAASIHAAPVDIFAPCAMGNEITASTAREIRARLICGAANNQLADETLADVLFSRGIWYIPDVLANAGGLLNVVDELESGGFDRARVQGRIEILAQKCGFICSQAAHEFRTPLSVAQKLFINRPEFALCN
ncbi:MAG: valine dehydrogenase [Candidatus Magasanikbacteria bacterium]|nr:valine dehydrogenase [Candidatus Magasanikbacteria bacterium]